MNVFPIHMFRQIKRGIQSKELNRKRDKEYSLQRKNQVNNLLSTIKILFITHDNNGGTRSFEKEYLYTHENIAILRRLCYGFMEEKYFSLEIYRNNKQDAYYLLKYNEIIEVFNFKFEYIIVNSLVTFQCYKELLNTIKEYKKENSNCNIKYFVHDFHGVCLNENLYTKDGYCNLRCKEKNCKLSLGKEKININEWRKEWSDFLESVDEIRCFSNSSKEIIQKAYPEIKNSSIIVKPHDISYCTDKPIVDVEKQALCIGFVGDISYLAKGKEIVADIVRCYGNDISIRIIGTSFWKYFIFRRKVKYLGKYKRDELREILIREKVSLVIFPSLCPETFSYLISELIEYDIPIICFNYGAQAEKVSNYHKGIVCSDIEEMYAVIEKYKKGFIKG